MSLFPPSPAPGFLRPSLFDLLAQDQLTDLFHPVLRYILSYLAQQYPRYFLRLVNHHEETYAFLLLLLQRYHLKKHNASISEHFYGLRLAPHPSLSSSHLPHLSSISPLRSQGLSRRQRWLMLLFLVGLPYARARAQDYYERLANVDVGEDASRDEGLGGDPRGLTIVRPSYISIGKSLMNHQTQLAFKRIYPYANTALDASFLLNDMLYLFERTEYYRPWHRWLKLRVLRATPEDQIQTSSISSYLPPLLPPLLLLLKLSQWWYSPSSPRTSSVLGTEKNTTSKTHAAILPPRPLPILPSSSSSIVSIPSSSQTTPLPSDNSPPDIYGSENGEKEEIEGKEFKVDKADYGKCPLCRKKWQNPAVLPSGWVVCWRCGWEAVEGDDDDDDEEEEGEGAGEGEGDDGLKEEEEEEQEKSRKGRRGRCPITGVAVGPGQLRRVLV
ncbi:hypothetical protein L198_01232 [Cryptococcus wingfieldii CBS 7118]|uniref:Peroxisome assembly protein 12 n=1 Tax=Cryptococcus wingfieldii CBS 7118 TaxID=1295528 RepID=A0A1E3K3M5_9TREE|nr:hypothetical protein L198_01232 [Cryptococcus wingfieldii CBS 7118]ODO07651.1 hypothetical protein L198_01232 [Cryptococcus wingfieldii CBS 7118]